MIDTTSNATSRQELHLPQMLTIKQVSEVMHLPQHYIRRLCKTVPGLAFASERLFQRQISPIPKTAACTTSVRRPLFHKGGSSIWQPFASEAIHTKSAAMTVTTPPASRSSAP